ncbi:nucleotide excision repair endonuclease [Echinicola soli]|uniref:Excinuclease cho n=1 Tax=Echinicola soli TaxID=2591634 RepID=A0A514CLD8_9BACT|nr:GIY-YIG nuclease family protein [Echinicola soli]QDH80643.1 nucleotide excision repair endonuclease [Echinicola soli]
MLSDNLKNILSNIPPAITGVYFFVDRSGRILYIGKSNDIRKRLHQHFHNTTSKALRMQNQVDQVKYENMGNELMALLRESELIKVHKPVFNRALRRSVFLWGLYLVDTAEGYMALQLKKINKDQRELMAFTAKSEGKEYLFRVTEQYQLCQKINGLYPSSGACFQYSLKTCKGACLGEEPTWVYNDRVRQFVQDISLPKEDRTILLEGRTAGERGVVLIENGVYRGYGYFKGELEKDVHLSTIIQPKTDDRDSQRLLRAYLRKQHSTAQ